MMFKNHNCSFSQNLPCRLSTQRYLKTAMDPSYLCLYASPQYWLKQVSTSSLYALCKRRPNHNDTIQVNHYLIVIVYTSDTISKAFLCVKRAK